MAAQPKTTIAGQLDAARTALSNSLGHPAIQYAVARYGYTPEKLREGSQLYDLAVSSMTAQAAAVAARHDATARMALAEQQVRASYQALAQLARAIFMREPSRRVALGLVGGASQNPAAFLVACEKLFGNAINVAEIKDALAEYGYTVARFEAERAVVDAFEQAYRSQGAAKATARQATHAQREALARLNQWVAQYLKIARIALQDTPDLLSHLGKAPRGAKAAASRSARKAAPVPTVVAALGD